MKSYVGMITVKKEQGQDKYFNQPKHTSSLVWPLLWFCYYLMFFHIKL